MLELVIGRWWALVGALGLALWVFLTWDDLEVPRSFLAAAYGAIAAVGIAAGVLLRRVGGRPGRS
jgi:hypothetical protein